MLHKNYFKDLFLCVILVLPTQASTANNTLTSLAKKLDETSRLQEETQDELTSLKTTVTNLTKKIDVALRLQEENRDGLVSIQETVTNLTKKVDADSDLQERTSRNQKPNE